MDFKYLSDIKVNLLSITIAFSFFISVSVADPYLDALDAEAESSYSVKDSVQDSAKVDASEDLHINDDEAKKKKLEFEKSLRTSLPATYTSYRMLSEEDKQNVVDIYYESNLSMPTATRLLFSLYFKK
ncbi:MAG: hypothetical protein OQK46_10280 [Gammaproteobacteria bacterium]|nr:hypothetical protein [Gammaproteobacteria bacterium]